MTDEEIGAMLPSLHYAILGYRAGKLAEFIAAGNTSPDEEYFTCFYDLLCIVPDFFTARYNEALESTSYYFSFRTMQEYYRLCRIYGGVHHIKLRENPYVKEASGFVYRSMDLGYYDSYCVYLQTRIGYEWASGVVIWVDENNFSGEYYIIEAMIEIKEWYEKKVYELRHQLLVEGAICLPALPAWNGG